jgi:hypothetical protein
MSIVQDVLKGVLLALSGLFMANVVLGIVLCGRAVLGRPLKANSLVSLLAAKNTAKRIWLSALAVAVLLIVLEVLRRQFGSP